jgi:putative chitinase
MIALDQLRAIMPMGGRKLAIFCDPLNSAMQEYGIDTPIRQQSFLAQIAHESGQLRFVREIWGPTPAQMRYEGRADLGNTEPGDGYRYMGRGLIQVTGRDNYRRCSIALYGNPHTLIDQPELLEEPLPAARSAGWYWDSRKLNDVADAGDFERLTRRINGGLNGYEDRLAALHRAQQVIAT